MRIQVHLLGEDVVFRKVKLVQRNALRLADLLEIVLVEELFQVPFSSHFLMVQFPLEVLLQFLVAEIEGEFVVFLRPLLRGVPQQVLLLAQFHRENFLDLHILAELSMQDRRQQLHFLTAHFSNFLPQFLLQENVFENFPQHFEVPHLPLIIQGRSRYGYRLAYLLRLDNQFLVVPLLLLFELIIWCERNEGLEGGIPQQLWKAFADHWVRRLYQLVGEFLQLEGVGLFEGELAVVEGKNGKRILVFFEAGITGQVIVSLLETLHELLFGLVFSKKERPHWHEFIVVLHKNDLYKI